MQTTDTPSINDALRAFFQVSPEEAALNRSGTVSPRQRALARASRTYAVMGVLCALFGASLILGALRADAPLEGLPGVFFAIIGIGFLVAALRTRGQDAAYQLRTVEGPIELRFVPRGRKTVYALFIAGEQFAIRRQQPGMEQKFPAGVYRAYVLGEVLLWVEALTETAQS